MEAIAATELLPQQDTGVIEYQVIHSTSGRFRIRIPRLSIDSEYASKLNWLLESFDFVVSVRINPLASSLIINYEASTISSKTAWSSLFDAIQQANSTEVPAGILLSDKLEIDWLERLGMPILSLGLAILAQQLFPIPALLVGGVVAAAAVPFISRTMEMMVRERRLDADLLDTLWLALFTVQGDFMGPALMLSLTETGDALRDTTARANERQMLDLMYGLERYARVEQNGQELTIPLGEVQQGDRVVVCAGEIIPVSGRVLRGTALIDEHKLTGESRLVSRSEGHVVHAATLLLEGKICILAKRVGKNTRLGLAVQLMHSAPVHDTRVEDYAAGVANAAIAPAMLLSGAIFAVTQDISRSLAPLHLDFGHAIRIAVPTTVLSALTYAARNGVYIRSGRALELLARIDTIVFDKTGTLTQGNAAVVAVKTLHGGISPQEILSLAAAAEQSNTHPVAKAIIRCATENQLEIIPATIRDYRVGLGIFAIVQERQILVGSDRFLQQEGIDVSIIHRQYPCLETDSYSIVYVARERELVGAILYTDPLRLESAGVIEHLQRQRMTTYILTGDGRQVTHHVAAGLGIDSAHTYAEVFPDRKVEVISELQQQGRTVAFIGEGINDAAALAHADVSLSFASGSDIARETADVVLLDNDLRGVSHAIDIAKRAMEIIYQNTAIATIPNIAVVLAGILLPLDPLLGVIISNGAALVAELNSFRPLFEPGSDSNLYTVKESPLPIVNQVAQVNYAVESMEAKLMGGTSPS